MELWIEFNWLMKQFGNGPLLIRQWFFGSFTDKLTDRATTDVSNSAVFHAVCSSHLPRLCALDNVQGQEQSYFYRICDRHYWN